MLANTGSRTAPIWLWLVFSIICFDLGYPSVARYDPATRIPDAGQYGRMVAQGFHGSYAPFCGRVLVPYLARPLYEVAQHRIGTWNPGYFALLTVNSAFMAGAALLVFMITSGVSHGEVPALSALLFLLNFCVSNQFLAGLVDSAEAFFLAAMVFALLTQRWWTLPILMGLGSLAKETVLPLGVCMSVTWIATGAPRTSLTRRLAWIAASAACGLITLSIVYTLQAGRFSPAWTIAMQQIHISINIREVAAAVLSSHELWLTFIYLLPLGLLRIRTLPLEWRWSTLVTTVLSFVLVVLHSAANDTGSTFSRSAFSISGPLLATSGAGFLRQCYENWRNSAPESVQVSTAAPKPK